MSWVGDVPHEVLAEFIAQARWFGGKGRDFEVTGVQEEPLTDDTVLALVTVAFADGEDALYQVPLVRYDEPQDRLFHAQVFVGESGHVYDAVHDREAMRVWLERFAEPAADTDDLVFHRVGEHELDLEAHSTLFPGEQSNSSVAFGEDSLMKVFRRLTPGINPDIEIHDALTRAGTTTIPQLYGWLEIRPAEPDGPPLQLAMLQQFLRTVTDGWDVALVSARNLFAEGDLHAGEVGGDFAGEAHRLGAAVSEVHQLLREHFPTEPFDAAAAAERMRARLHEAVEAVPELAPHREALERALAALGERAGEGTRAQRIHGDLHLGQTMRTSLGWKLVDFEGEPAKPLAERRLPDSPWRDVAGMLRSFDYAAQAAVKDLHAVGDPGAQIAYRATEWVERNRTAFLEGYVESRESALTEDEETVIAAYEADKAVYEVVYEARNRPSWIDIPLASVERIGGDR